MDERSALRTGRQATNARVGAVLFSLALFGYPLVATLVAFLQIDSRQLSLPFRIFVALLSLYIIAVKGRLRLTKWHLMMSLIWCALALRLSFDALFAGIDSAVFQLQFFIITSVLPVLALWKLNVYDQSRFASAGLILASLGCVMNLLGNYFGVFGGGDLTDTLNRLSTDVLDPITIGHLAVSGIFCCLVLARHKSFRVQSLIVVLIAVLIVVLVLSGSKGPLLSLVVALATWCWKRGFSRRFILVVVPVIAAFLLYGGNPLAERVLESEDAASSLERLVLIEDSIEQILNSPWIGSASVELKSGYYPHNILVEGPMSLGFPLTFMLLVLLARGLVASLRLLSTDYDLVALLFIQTQVAALTSGALFASFMMWACLVILLALDSSTKRSVKSSRNA
jgi:O-Antigen ligase